MFAAKGFRYMTPDFQSRKWVSARLVALAFLTLIFAVLVVLLRDSERAKAAAGDQCTPNCVMLVEVPGLEPQDVDPTTTPVLWSLAHPDNSQGGAIPHTGRSGFTWQASRAVMGAGEAANTMALLTGGYARETGVPGDEYIEVDKAKNTQQSKRLQPVTGGNGDIVAGDADGAASTLYDLLNNDGRKSAAFIGDPALGSVAGNQAPAGNTPLNWTPNSEDTNNPGDPSLCPVPRDPSSQDPQHSDPCPARDQVTLNKAYTDLTSAAGKKVSFTYVQLAELGAVLRRTGTADPQARHDALKDLDVAMGAFIERIEGGQDPDLQKTFQKTVLFVVGGHGYENTPITNRVPDPNNPNPDSGDTSGNELTDFPRTTGTQMFKAPDVTVVPQGTMATVYAQPNSEAASHLPELKTALERANDSSRCAQSTPITDTSGKCIDVLPISYDPTGDDPNVIEGPDDTPDTVGELHPTWQMDSVNPKTFKLKSGSDNIDFNTGERTGTGGDLLVVTHQGWGVGRAVPDPVAVTSSDSSLITNADLGSSGGPRDRAVAAIVNGPSGTGASNAVVQVQGTAANAAGRYPVTSGPASDASNPNCYQGTADPQPAGDLAAANAKPGDDANDVGHECQPEAVDFMPTIAALMQISDIPPEQLPGRFLNEAFKSKLGLPLVVEEDLGEALPDELPPPPPAEIKQKVDPGFTYKGVFRNGEAQVVDASGLPVICPKLTGDKKSAKSKDPTKCKKAKRGAKLDFIELRGDFGKPESVVQLTFYRQIRSKGGRKKLKTIAQFDPFTLKRGPVKMKLKVPPQFKPTHIGIVVQEAKKIGKTACKKKFSALKKAALKKGRRPPTQVLCYDGVGTPAGSIIQIKAGDLLHDTQK
jgi:type I phosphodiesterase/nucleotide pyrophosphatase